MYIRSASQLHLFAKPWDLKYLFVIHLLLMLGWWRNVRETWVAPAWFSRLQSQTLCPFSMFKDENHLVQFDEFLQWFWNSKITRQIKLVLHYLAFECCNLTNFSSDFGFRKLLVKLNWFDYFAYELSPLPFGEFYEGEKHWRFGEYNFILALIIMLLLIVDFQTTLYLENQFWWSDLWWILILQAQVQQFAPWIL